MTATIPNGLTVEKISADTPDGGSILAMANRLIFPKVSAAPSNPFTCHISGSQLTCNASTLLVGTYHLFAASKISSTFTGGTLVLAAHITSATPDPNPNDTSATDTLSDVLSGGLANTGTSLIWITGVAATLLVAGIVIWNFKRKYKNAHQTD
jgi:hypothetical protein